MKKTIYITITSLICIGLGNSAIAEESSLLSSLSKSHFKKDFSASVGVKAWNTEFDGFVNNKELVLIPNLNLRYKNFFVSSSYFPETDYNTYTSYKFNNYSSEYNTLLNRSEFDINLGYYILPYLMVTAGYKNIDNDNLYQSTIIDNGNVTNDENPNKAKINGPTIGIAGVAPLRGKFGMYGNFSFGWLKDDSSDVEYKLGELGLIYSYKEDYTNVFESASIHLGYRFQALGYENSQYNNTTNGFVLGVNLNF